MKPLAYTFGVAIIASAMISWPIFPFQAKEDVLLEERGVGVRKKLNTGLDLDGSHKESA